MTVIQIVTNKVWGGGERYVLDLASALSADGHTVCIVGRKGYPAATQPMRDKGLRVTELPFGGLFDFTTVPALARMLREHTGEPTVVHTHNFKDAALAVKAKRRSGRTDVRVVCTRHLVKPGKEHMGHGADYADLHRIIFVSDLARRAFIEGHPQLSLTHTCVIHNAVSPTEPVHRAMPEYRAGMDLHLAFLGRITPEKGLETLIRALSDPTLRHAKVDVYGTGDEQYVAKLKEQALQQAPTQFTWHGKVDNIWPALQRAHALVAPSVAREAFGLVLIEAMAAGRPVIASNNGAQAEIVTHGRNGLLVGPGDAHALVHAIKKLMANPDDLVQMGHSALSTAMSRFSFQTFYQNTLKAYSS